MARATSSLPEPFSPWMSTRPLEGAAIGDLLAQVLDQRALADDLLAALDLRPQGCGSPARGGRARGPGSTTRSVFSSESGFSMKS